MTAQRAMALPRCIPAWCALGCLTAGCGEPAPPEVPAPDDTITLTGYIFTAEAVVDLRIGAFDVVDVEPASPDDEGVFTLVGLPRGQPFMLQTTGQGLVSTLQQVPASEENIYGFRAAAPVVGGTTYPDGLPAERADVWALVQRDAYSKRGLALAQATVDPSAAESPDYGNEAGATDLRGRVLIRGVTPPEVQLAILTDRPCTAATGWTGDGQGEVVVPVAAGFVTLVETVCADPEGARVVQGDVTDVDTDEPIGGAEICTDDAACATANEAGVFQLAIADGEDRVLTMTAAGFAPLQRAIRNEWEAGGTLNLDSMTTGAWSALTGAAGVTQAPDRGFVWLRANGSSWQAGLSPNGDNGLFYLDAAGSPDPGLTAATLAGQAIVPNLPPGEVELDLTHPGLDCRASTGWEWSPDPIRLPVTAATITDVRAVCFPAASE